MMQTSLPTRIQGVTNISIFSHSLWLVLLSTVIPTYLWASPTYEIQKELACTTTNLSSLSWDEETNGWGPAEKNKSNGEQNGGDGNTIRIGGRSYSTGLGVHGTSRISYTLNGNYNRFFSDIGVDEEVGNNGSVVFEVLLDGELAYASPVLKGSDGPLSMELNVSGVNEMVLIVSDGGDGNEFDHADWAGAKLEADCDTEKCNSPAIPTITSLSSSQAGFTWSYPGQGNYNIQYREVGTSAWSFTINIVNPSIVVNNLNAGTTYEWQISANCSGEQSEWINGENFTTKGGGLSCGQITSLTKVSIRSYQASLSWSGANNGKIRYREENEGTWNILSFTGGSKTIYGLQPQKKYYWQVQEDCGNTNSNWVPGPHFTTTKSSCELPSGWTSHDIGNIKVPGGVCVEGNDWMVEGAGSDIFGTKDEFHFVKLPLVGDGEMIAKINGMELTNGWAKAGLMIRRNLNEDGKYVMVGLTPSNGALLQIRQNNGENTIVNTNSSQGFPNWLRIVREGSSVSGYISENGTNWNNIGGQVNLGSGNMHIGLAVSSHDAGELNTSIFSDVSVQTSTITFPGFTVNPDTLNVDFEQGTYSAAITSANAWTATSPNGFLSFDPASGQGNTDLSVTVNRNPNTNQRTGRITITSNGESKLLVISQAPNSNPCTKAQNLTVGDLGKNLVKLSWDTDGSATYLLQFREAGSNNWTSRNDLPASSVPYLLTGLKENTEYQWRVRARCELSQASFTSGPNFTTLAESVCELPGDWQAMDIGNVAIAGEACEDNGSWTVFASGTDIWGSNDQFHFIYQDLEGNMELTAQVTEIGNADVWSKAGLMIREKVSSGSRNIAIVVTPQRGIQHQNRQTENQSSTNVNQGQLTAPYWVRIRRESGQITTYYSETGENASWTKLGPELSLGNGDLYIGLAHTAHTNSVLNKAVFSNVSLQQIPPSLTISPDSMNLPVSAGDSSITISANVGWTASEESDWLVLDNPDGTGNGPLRFAYEENSETTARTAIVSVQAGGVTKTLTLTQAGRVVIPPSLSVAPANFELEAEAVDTFSIVTANVEWSASSEANWVNVVTTSGSGNDSLYFSVKENIGDEIRNATILLDDGNGTTATITISQVAVSTPPAPIFTITQPTDSSEVSLPFSVLYELENGIIAPDSFYIQYTIDDSLSGTWNKADSLTFLNLGEGFRKIVLRLGLPGGQLTPYADSVVVKVVFPPYLDVSPDTLKIGPSATIEEIDIQTNQEWIISEDIPWMIPGLIAARGSSLVDLIFEENTDTTSRTGVVYIQAGSFEDTIVVIQEKLLLPACENPDKLELAFLTDTSAIISWDGGAGADTYVLRYQEENATEWTEIAGLTETSLELTGLMSEMAYLVQIKTICAFGETYWSDSLSFETFAANMPFCPQVLGLSDEVLSDSSVYLSWNSTEAIVDFTIRYKAVGESDWLVIPSTSQDSNWVLEDLDPKLSYEWQVKGICDNDSALWSASSTFTTGTLFPPCQPVSGINIAEVTDSTALIRWNPAEGVAGYVLSWQVLSGSTTSSSDTLTTTEYLIEFLFPDTPYEFSIASICSAGPSLSSDTLEFQTTSGGVIPKETVFSSFTLTQIGPAVQLDWSIKEGLVGKAWFSVERSFDGQFFERVATVEVEEFIDSDSTTYLYFDDRVPFEEWMYYRVRLLFNSGQYSLTQTRRIRVERPDIEAWIYPNPARDKTELSVLSPGEVTLTISLYSHLGNEIFKRDLPVGAGWVKREVDLSGLRPGMYYLTVYDPNPNPYIRQSKSMILMIN